MSLVTQELNSVIMKYINRVATAISKRFDIDLNELKAVMNETTPMKSVSKTIIRSSKSSKEKSGEACPYVYQRGDKKGEICGVVSKSGNTYCSKHKRYDPNTGYVPGSRKTSANSSRRSSIVSSKNTPVSTPKSKFQLNKELERELGQKVYVHSRSGMVIDRNNTPLGEFKDGKFIPEPDNEEENEDIDDTVSDALLGDIDVDEIENDCLETILSSESPKQIPDGIKARLEMEITPPGSPISDTLEEEYQEPAE